MTMKSIMSAMLVSGALMSTATTAQAVDFVVVDSGAVTIPLSQFTAKTTRWAGREVVTGYETLIDVSGAEHPSSLVFDVKTALNAKWFTGSMTLVTKVSCSGNAAGGAKSYGVRGTGSTVDLTSRFTELRHTDVCDQLKIELAKQGSLSRQYYSQIQDGVVEVTIKALKQGGK